MAILNRYELTIASGASVTAIQRLRATEIPLALEVTAVNGVLYPQSSFTDTPQNIISENIPVSVSGTGFHVLPAATYVAVRQFRIQASTNQTSARTFVLITGEL